MKTFREWFKELPGPYGEQAIANCKKQRSRDFIDEEVKDLATAIDMGFTWNSTKEGHDYWKNIHFCAKENKEIEFNPMDIPE